MYIQSIDELSLWNWRKCVDGKIEFTRLKKTVGTKAKDAEAWIKLLDQHIERFGLGKDHEQIINLKLELAELQCDYCIEGNAFLLNRIRMIEQDMKDIIERAQNGATVDECLMALSKWMGFHLKQKEVTVVEFNTYLEGFQKAGKQNKPQKTA